MITGLNGLVFWGFRVYVEAVRCSVLQGVGFTQACNSCGAKLSFMGMMSCRGDVTRSSMNLIHVL